MKTNTWQQLIITTPEQYAEIISDQLTELGALAVSLIDAGDQPLFQLMPEQTPLWRITKIMALFPAECDIEPVIKAIKNLTGTDDLEFSNYLLEDQDWVRQTQENFPPQCFADDLWVIPSWCDAKDFQGHIIKIEPGLAFGTGTHETTALCLEWLAENPPLDLTVIDYGCGSGILALSALALGAKAVYAVDHDPQALISTENNANLNPSIKQKLSIHNNETMPAIKAPLVIANILSSPLIELAPTIKSLCTDNATLILSGILEAEAGNVAKAYAPQFNLQSLKSKGEWTCLVLHSKAFEN